MAPRMRTLMTVWISVTVTMLLVVSTSAALGSPLQGVSSALSPTEETVDQPWVASQEETSSEPACDTTSSSTEEAPAPPVSDEAHVPDTQTDNLEASFRLCGEGNEQVEEAIERLVAGRGFSARLVGKSDGCSDLTISVSPHSYTSGLGGQQSSTLSVSSGGSGTTTRFWIQIVSRDGATEAEIRTESGT